MHDFVNRFLEYTNTKTTAEDAFIELDKKSLQFSKSDFTAALDPKNRKLNRYTNILAPDHSRIVLKTSESDYINANLLAYNTSRYIVGQYPTLESIWSFWQMVLQESVSLILTLSPLKENGSLKGTIYWPETFDRHLINSSDSGSVQLRSVQEKLGGLLIIRELLVTLGGLSKTCIQMEFLGWSDFSVITPPLMLKLYTEFCNIRSNFNFQDNVYIHCSAGVGRTGVFVTLDTVISQLASGNSSNEDPVAKALLHYRSQRPALVQTPSQLRFIYECLDYFTKVGKL